VFIRAAGAALLLASVTAEATDRRTQVVALPPDRAIVVDLTIGTLRVQGEPRRDAEIDIARHARDAAALARIPVVVDETPTEVRIRARQADGGTDPSLRTRGAPGDAAGDGRAHCVVGAEWRGDSRPPARPD
jgi:hypothetical protein